MNMTLRRLAPLVARASEDAATDADVNRLGLALALRRHERGPSKLARRLRRKATLGRAGAF